MGTIWENFSQDTFPYTHIPEKKRRKALILNGQANKIISFSIKLKNK
jgi:hypothetical protein